MSSNFPRWRGDSTTPFVLNLAHDLQALGWTVDVLAPHAAGTARMEMIDGVRVERFRYLWPANAQTVCYQGGALVNLRKNRRNMLKLPALVMALWAATLQRLASRRYALLHAHWILPQGFVAALSARPLAIPNVVTVHGGDVFALKGRALERCKRYALRSADAVTVNSSATQQEAVRIAGPLPTLERIPMGVQVRAVDKRCAKVQAVRRRHRRAGGPLLVFAGRLVDEKGCADLLHAVRLLQRDLPGVSALVIGEGQDRRALEALAVELEIAERVAFLGWVQPHEMLDHLAAADVFVGPSRTGADGWVEAQGLTFLEAMVARTPVVATRSGGIVDAVRDGITGLLVAERAPAEIAAAVRRLVTQDGLARSLVRGAHAWVAASGSRQASAAAFDRCFRRLIGATSHAKLPV